MKNTIKINKKELTAAFAIILMMLTAISIAKILGTTFADNTFNYANGKYIITNDTQMEVQFTGVLKKSITSVEIPATIKINEQNYKVTGIKANALKGNTKVKNMTVGSNVKTIGKKAFYGCKNLKSITINTFNLKSKTVGAAAFKGLNAKVVVIVPENKLKAYKKMLKSKGLSGKKQVVKGRKIVTEEKEDKDELDPNRDIPAPTTMFTIDDYFGLMSNIREEDGYSVGDSIPITAGFQMNDLMYGKWTTRTADGNGLWIACNECGKMFDNQDDYGVSSGHQIDGCISASFNFGYDYGKPFTAWHWNPDDRACNAIFHITLPVGLSYKEGSLKMFQMTKKEVASSAYHVDVNGQDITVTIDNIKDAAIHPGNLAEKISITMDTELNSNAAAINTITASMSYDNGMGVKTVDMGSATIYAATMKFRNTDINGNDISGAKFALYKYKTLKSGNVYYDKWVKILDNITGNPCIIAGLNSGKYRLVQTAAPDGYKKMSNYEFNISMSGSGGNIDNLSVDDGNRYPWETDLETGVVSTTIVNN